MGSCWSRSVLLAVAGLLASCTDDSSSSDVPTEPRAGLLVPFDSYCARGAGPLQCWVVPIIDASGGDSRAWDLDGLFEPEEYRGAVNFPYTNSQHSSSVGRVHVIAQRNPGPFNSSLHIYLENIPVDGSEDNSLVVHLDYERFEDDPDLTPTDAAFAIDIDSGATEYRSGDVASWNPDSAPFFWDAVMGDCTPGTRLPVRLCNAEFVIILDDANVNHASPIDLPGVGFAVTDDNGTGSFPWEVADPFDAIDESLDRLNYQTLLFGDPEGRPLTVVSWNLAHFGLFESIFAGDFSSHDLADVAAFIGPADIVAVQEMWTTAGARELRDELTAAHPGTYQMYGPISFPPKFVQEWFSATPPEPLALYEAHGGLFIFSTLPALAEGYTIFDDCRGEDCLKAKGVQWVRFAMNYPSGANVNPVCRQGSPPTGPCPPVPTTEAFVDVFNTHMQAFGDVVCGGASAITSPLTELITLKDVNCGRTAANVRIGQQRQLSDFIDEVTDGAQDRPVLVMGDMNFDGQRLNHAPVGGTPDTTYGTALQEMGVLAAGADPLASEPNDLLTPFPAEFLWDIHHADIQRDLPISWDPAPPGVSPPPLRVGTGNFIDTDPVNDVTPPAGGSFPPNTLHDRDGLAERTMLMEPDGNSRLDYMFVRPPAGNPHFNYMIGRSEATLLEVPWPEVPNAAGMKTFATSPPVRLSDHMPLIANLEFISLRHPPPYHPNVPHEYQYRVVSVDANGEEDCFAGTCNPLDMKLTLDGELQHPGGVWSAAPGHPRKTNQCEAWEVTPEDACAFDWGWSHSQDPALQRQHRARVRLWDDDSTSGHDDLKTVPSDASNPGETFPVLMIEWDTGFASGMREDSHTALPGFFDHPLQSNDPIRYCSRDRPVNMCIEIHFDELPP